MFAVWDKVQNQERLTMSDGIKLFESDDLSAIGRIADFAKKRVTGDKVYFVLNLSLIHI